MVSLYGLAPEHTWEETFSLVTSLYQEEAKKGKPVVMMGDSAGGGFVAAVCEYLAESKLSQPEKVCLLSPWLDITMPGDYSEFAAIAPCLMWKSCEN